MTKAPEYPIKKGDRELFGLASAVFDSARDFVYADNVLEFRNLHPDAVSITKKATRRLEKILKTTGTKPYKVGN